jgi:hypothetical protein
MLWHGLKGAILGMVNPISSDGCATSRVSRQRFGRLGLLPCVRQELVEFALQREGQPGKESGQVTLRIDAVAIGAGDERIQDRRGLFRNSLMLRR